MRFRLSGDNKSGIILIVVLWILVILSVVAIGLGRAARTDLNLTKHRIGKLRSDFLLWGAFNYSINQIRIGNDRDQGGSNPRADTLYQCGFRLDNGKTSQDLFKGVAVGDGSFEISYVLKDENGSSQVCYGFQDEERRINVAAINAANAGILVELFEVLNIDTGVAERLAAQAADWQDPDSELTNAPYGAERDDYLSLAKPYGCKDSPIESLEELLLLKDMTPQIFAKIKGYLAVIPQKAMLKINVNTAPDIVLRAVLQFAAKKSPGIKNVDVDRLVRKIIAYRNGDDQRPCTEDDQAILSNSAGPLGLDASENALYLTASGYFSDRSDYFRVCAKATEGLYKVSSQAEAVVGREGLSFALWKRR